MKLGRIETLMIFYKFVFTARLIESITTMRNGRGNPIRVSMTCIHDEACRVVNVANHGHEDGNPLSLP